MIRFAKTPRGRDLSWQKTVEMIDEYAIEWFPVHERNLFLSARHPCQPHSKRWGIQQLTSSSVKVWGVRFPHA